MFDVDFDDMFADVWFDDRDRAIADQEGIGKFENGVNVFHSIDALIIIRKYDRVLKKDHYSSKLNRIRAQRNAIVNAFGPDMVDKVGFA